MLGANDGTLAFWARNMTALRDAGMAWPGFSYTDGEWARLSALATGVSDVAFRRFQGVTAVAFIVLAGLGMAGIFLPLALLLFPVPAATRPLPFVLLLAATSALILGLGLPLSMRIGAAVAAGALREPLVASSDDAALARKVAYQIERITLIACGFFVPGTLLWIAFNIPAGPLVTVIKWLSIAALATSLAYSAKPKAP